MNSALKTLFNFRHRSPDEKAETAARFLAKSENFRLLLAANNKTLELMAEMNQAAGTGSVSGIAQVRAQSLQVAAGVRQMIERLCRMTPGKYDTLRDVFNDIVLRMDLVLNAHLSLPPGPLVLDLETIRADALPETGSKIALLGEIRANLDVTVPKGFAITASAFRLFMESTDLADEINRLIQIHGGHDLHELRDLEKSIRNAIDMTPMPSEIETAIQAQCDRLGAASLAVRSSALGEDGKHASYAGQFRSMLGVKPVELMEAYREVIASMYSATAMTYILNRGLREDEMVMAVGCMEMVDAKAGGVVYTRSPTGGNGDEILVTAVAGLPSVAVDGSSHADSWTIDRKSMEILHREITEKDIRQVLAADGRIDTEDNGSTGTVPAITDAVAGELARLAVRIENYFGHPQDIEWAQAHGGEIYILQCRPLAICTTEAEPHETDEKDAPFTVLTGCIPASPGAASGCVFKVENDDDMLRFPDGAILLARNARPQLSALLPKAGGLITEHGNSMGHLANVAREFGIPALIGAPGAFEKLSGISLVTVNGSTGTVFLGHRQGQIAQSARSATPARDSDVIQALRSVLKLIAPLTLTDPESPDFRPDRCETLHDITRYCHEKGVMEMFTTEGRPTSNARRLTDFCNTQYWLVDIGGGTAEASQGKTIGLEDISSNAMIALWNGMMAVPWEGPPPVRVNGFMSVLTTAASNPALTPGMANTMGDRNYFIVGRHYCNLQSRFGFHFCTIEGFAGDDPNENHALFHFKGGGADMKRRHSRSLLVAEVLERHGFIVKVRDDALFARLEGISREAAEQALAISGYLLMHTRQIDMVMTDSDAVRRYREKFIGDIDKVLSSMPGEHKGTRCAS